MPTAAPRNTTFGKANIHSQEKQQQQHARPDEGYMAMGAPGLLHPKDPSVSPGPVGNGHSEPASHRSSGISQTNLIRSTSGTSTHQPHTFHSQVNSSRQNILRSDGESLGSPMDDQSFHKLSMSTSTLPAYQNTASTERYVPPAVMAGVERPTTPEAPYYGETNPQYSVIGPLKTRTGDSVLYGKRAGRRSRGSSSGYDKDNAARSFSTSLWLIILIMVVFCIAALGLSVYLLITRSNESCSCGSPSSNGEPVASAVSQSDVDRLEQRITELSRMIPVSATVDPTDATSSTSIIQRIDSLEASINSRMTTANEQIASAETSIVSLQSSVASTSASVGFAEANISRLQVVAAQHPILSQRTADVVQAAVDGGIYFNCSQRLRACRVTASIDGSEESCNNLGIPTFAPPGFVIIRATCDVDNLNAVSYLVRRLDPTQGEGYSCNSRFLGQATRAGEELVATLRIEFCMRT